MMPTDQSLDRGEPIKKHRRSETLLDHWDVHEPHPDTLHSLSKCCASRSSLTNTLHKESTELCSTGPRRQPHLRVSRRHGHSSCLSETGRGASHLQRVHQHQNSGSKYAPTPKRRRKRNTSQQRNKLPKKDTEDNLAARMPKGNMRYSTMDPSWKNTIVLTRLQRPENPSGLPAWLT